MYHVNVETNEITMPSYVIHDDTKICGFFVQYRFLSNFYPCKNGIWWMGTRFRSTEHAYQAAKFPKKYHSEFVHVSAGDSKKIAKFISKEDPSLFNKSNWELVKFRVMSELVFQKFSLDPTLQQMLVDTGDKFLEESNSWHDHYWGVCDSKGQNHLGKLLMKIRTFWRNS